MKKMMLATLLVSIGTIQGAEKASLFSSFEQPVADGYVRILGMQDSSFKDITKKLALSIPQVATKVGDLFVCLPDASKYDLSILESYAVLLSNPQVLEETIKSFSLGVLCRQTIFLGKCYDKIIPDGFEDAWRYQLNECSIGMGTVESLIENADVVNFIYGAFQDKEALKARSSLNASDFSKDQDGLYPIYPSQEELAAQNNARKNSQEDEFKKLLIESSRAAEKMKRIAEEEQNEFDNLKKEPHSKIAQIIAGASNFWKQCEPLEKCVHVGLGFLIIFATYKLWQRGY